MLYREFVARLLDSQAYYLILSLDQSKRGNVQKEPKTITTITTLQYNYIVVVFTGIWQQLWAI